MRIANVNMVYLVSVKHMSEELTLQILISLLFTCLFITWGNFFIELSFEFWNSTSGALEILIHSLSHWGIHQSDVFTQNAEGLCAPTRVLRLRKYRSNTLVFRGTEKLSFWSEKKMKNRWKKSLERKRLRRGVGKEF